MRARDLKSSEFEVVRPDATLDEVTRKLEASGSDWLPVCQDRRLVGMIRAADISPRVLGMERGWQTRARHALAPDVIYCFEDTDVAEAAALMRERRVGCLPVLNARRELVGILALKDIPAEEASPGATPTLLGPEHGC